MPHDDRIRQEAAAWAVRTGDPSFEEWDDFTCWLEQDAAHAEAYDRVALAVADAAEADAGGERLRPANDQAPARGGMSRRWFGGAVAASLAAALALGLWTTRDASYAVETAPGEVRTIALADGGTIDLSGGTRLLLERGEDRFARLERGQALFTIRHDEAAPFVLEVGEDTLVDAGTVFDVRRSPTRMSVAVAEGAVVFNPAAQAVRLEPGDLLASEAGSAGYSVRRVPVEQVGEWREGRVTFADAPLGEIAGELSRTTGLAFRAAPGSAARTYSGSILTGPLRADPRSLGPLLGVEVSAAGEGWVIEAP